MHMCSKDQQIRVFQAFVDVAKGLSSGDGTALPTPQHPPIYHTTDSACQRDDDLASAPRSYPPMNVQTLPKPSPPAAEELDRLAQQVTEILHSNEGLDERLTRDFHRASEVIPDLVQKETRPEDFLRVEDYVPQRAAERIARYWNYRRELFGERWLLPMTQTGTGALPPRDIETLRSGFVKVVQSATHGTLYITDFTLLPKHAATNVHLQIYFYLATLLACDITILFVIRPGQRPILAANGKLAYISQVTAIRIKKFFVAQAYEEGHKHLLDFLGFQQQRMTQLNFQQQPLVIAGSSLQSTLAALQAEGFDPTCLPCELGGRVDQSFFHDWVRARLTVEEVLAAAPLLRRAVPHPTHCAQKTLVVATKRVKRGQEYPSLVRRPGESAQAFAKRKNACQVRRNYHRQKMEILTTQGQVEQAKARRASLLAEHQRLQNLMEQARAIVCQYQVSSMTALPAVVPFAAPSMGDSLMQARVDTGDEDDDSDSYVAILLQADDSLIDGVEYSID